MIMSWEPTLGGGTSKTLEVPEELQDLRQRLNFVGHPEVTRFLSFCALKETYTDDGEVLPAALRHIVSDFQAALSDGILVDYQGEQIRIRLACLVTKGDWPWLIEAGHLCRHFRRAAKREHAVNPNVGLCHFCFAGTQGIPCSDTGDDTAWMRSMGSAASFIAWEAESPLLVGLMQSPGEPAMIYRPDLFHNWHLGMGQCFCASTLVILSNMCTGSSIPKRFDELTQLWRTWCRDMQLGPQFYLWFCVVFKVCSLSPIYPNMFFFETGSLKLMSGHSNHTCPRLRERPVLGWVLRTGQKVAGRRAQLRQSFVHLASSQALFSLVVCGLGVLKSATNPGSEAIFPTTIICIFAAQHSKIQIMVQEAEKRYSNFFLSGVA